MTSEQPYWYQQANLCKDKTACSNILSSDNPVNAKMYSYTIQLTKQSGQKLNME